ncbi:MAG TPA: hypothetical protein VM597_29670, partial [Gemmataceae bacterium]|nr:hypothetical protein [Gemmataceae bacterium]
SSLAYAIPLLLKERQLGHKWSGTSGHMLAGKPHEHVCIGWDRNKCWAIRESFKRLEDWQVFPRKKVASHPARGHAVKELLPSRESAALVENVEHPPKVVAPEPFFFRHRLAIRRTTVFHT